MGSRRRLILAITDGAQQAFRMATIVATWRRGHHKIFRVRGLSMHPTLSPGDYVVVDTRDAASVDLDCIVVAREPKAQTVVIKRVRSRGDSTVYLGSDDPNVGTDSRQFGSVSTEDVIGPVTLHIPLGRLLQNRE